MKVGLALDVSRFRAVERAEVDLTAITVMAGADVCDKGQKIFMVVGSKAPWIVR